MLRALRPYVVFLTLEVKLGIYSQVGSSLVMLELKKHEVLFWCVHLGELYLLAVSRNYESLFVSIYFVLRVSFSAQPVISPLKKSE